MKLEEQRKINEYLNTKGFNTINKVLEFFNDKENVYIENNKHLIKNEEYRIKVLKIYFKYCNLYITDIETALNIDLNNNDTLINSMGSFVVCADFKFKYKLDENRENSIESSWFTDGNNDIEGRITDEIIEYFYIQIKELKLKSVFFTKDELKKEMMVFILKWMETKIKESDISQNLFEELPELIANCYEENTTPKKEVNV
jgi:hypothetical protein